MTCRLPLIDACLLAVMTLCAGLDPALGQSTVSPDPDAPLSPQETVERMQLPAGFRATVFAAEPHVVQPIAFTFDDRGRLWVVECLSYPDWHEDPGRGRDRVIILEDTSGDGRFDRRTVFWDRGSNLTGIELGFGGVWLCSTPNLIFVPERNRDDRPDGPPEIVLDGWDLAAKHNVFNGLTWGPDGWLYGCNGILSNSKVGPPGAPDHERVEFNCGVWRVHPVTRQFEPVAWGTTNPWGLDFDTHGRMFITNCVIKHLFHVIPGAHYERMYGQDLNPHVYGLMASCADHIHWGGGEWTSSRGGAGVHDAPGGGHAHAGCMIYLGDNWPAEYRGGLFTCNVHGNRVNMDELEADRSGYIARHGRDFLRVPDPWFRGLEVKYGPDGGVYVSDWSDTGECHDYEDIHRENGRIYKVTFGDVRPAPTDLNRLSDRELVALQFQENEWHVRHARRILHERAAAGTLAAWPELRDALNGGDADIDETVRELRTLWLRHVAGSLGEVEVQFALHSDRELVRAWAVRLELDDRRVSETMLSRFTSLARTDVSPIVRLFLASSLQRLPLEQRWDIAAGLLAHAEDADDPNLPLMNWYGVEPLLSADPARAADLLVTSRQAAVRRHAARRLVSLDGGIEYAADRIGQLMPLDDPAAVRDVLGGLHHEMKGRRHVQAPQAWADVSNELLNSRDPGVRDLSTHLALIFGDLQALANLRRIVGDDQAQAADRCRAVEALAQISDGELPGILQRIVARERTLVSGDGPSLTSAALRAMAVFDDAGIPQFILAQYARLSAAERSDAVSTLAARPEWSLALLEAIASGQVPRKDLSAFTARQVAGLGDERVIHKLKAVWGDVRESSQDKLALREAYRSKLTPDLLAQADREQGRLVFRRTCAACHVLFDEGRRVGPDLTGSQRTNLDYLLENVLEPSSVVGRDYKVTTVLTSAGRVISGIITEETTSSLTLQTETEAVIIAKDDIDDRRQQNVSMMPEGIVEKLSDDELRNLVAYLMGDSQVALPADESDQEDAK